MANLVAMAKDKAKDDGAKDRGRAPRHPVQLPIPWFRVLKKLARMDEKKHTQYLLKVLHEKATDAGIEDLPPLPWDDEEEG
jgi:hypothetical protein